MQFENKFSLVDEFIILIILLDLFASIISNIIYEFNKVSYDDIIKTKIVLIASF